MTQRFLGLPTRGVPSFAALICAALAVFVLLGCATAPPVIEQPAPRPLGATLPAYAAAAAPVSGPEPVPLVEEPQAVIDLRDALAAALLGNPELAAFSWEVRAGEARALQAGLRPNPELDLELENVAGSGDFTGTDAVETTLQLGQLIELGGKRVKRRRVAELDATLAGWDYEVRRLAVFSEVVRAFADVLAAQEQLRLGRELLDLANESLESVARQVGAGATSPVERTRAQVGVSSREIEQRRAEAVLAAARLRLAATWGSREARYEEARGELQEIEPPPVLPELVAQLDQSPEIARWVEEIELREAVVALEDAQRVPDVVASAGVRRLEESNDTALVVGASVPFPVFDRNQGARLAARRELAKARHLQRGARVQVETGLRIAHAELTSSYQEVTALHERALPQADEAYRGIRQGYLRGLFRYVDVLDAQRTLFELRSQELDALRIYHGAIAELERLTGMPLRRETTFLPSAPETQGIQP